MWKALARILGTRRFRGEVAGRIVDVRIGVWGDQMVLVDGALVSKKPWAGFTGSTSHFFAITDADKAPHNAEVRIIDRSGGFMVALKVEVWLDGRAAVRIHEVGGEDAWDKCPRCGYSLAGLEPENGELKCPECGRHTAEEMVR